MFERKAREGDVTDDEVLTEMVVTEIMYIDGRFFDGEIPPYMARALATAVVALIRGAAIDVPQSEALRELVEQVALALAVPHIQPQEWHRKMARVAIAIIRPAVLEEAERIVDERLGAVMGSVTLGETEDWRRGFVEACRRINGRLAMAREGT